MYRTSSNRIVVLIVTGVICCGRLWGFSIPIHREITRTVLQAITATVAGQTKHFSQRALEQIADANESVDSIATGSAALFHPERHFTNEDFAGGSTRLRDYKTNIVNLVRATPPDGTRARRLLGEALHTVQDFYSHSNWVEQGKGSINSAFGVSVLANPPVALQACPNNPNTLGPGGGGGDTSGYFVGFSLNRNTIGCGTLPSAGKCYHGNETMGCIGINKDNDGTVNGIPPSPFHGAARRVAEQATDNYVRLILSDIAGNDRAVAALLDVKGTIGFVVDDTGSMGDEIDGVKSNIVSIINALNSDPDTRPDNWLLERFGDPDVGPAFVTDDANALLSAVSALTPHGGGDCPEFSQAGLREAIDRAFPNSKLYLFTDASAKDSGDANTVISNAQAKSINLEYALTGSCSPVDPAYIRGADETGGQLFFINPSEVSKLFSIIEPQLAGDLVTIFSAKGQLTSGSKTFDIPVDSTITRLVVSVSTGSPTSVQLQRPNGAVVSASDADTKITDLSSARIFIISKPAMGLWHFELSSSGEFSVFAAGNSPIEFRRFDFVEANDDVHGGFFPVQDQPLAGASSTGEATLLGPFATANFSLTDQNGGAIQTVPLIQNFPDAARAHFVGVFQPPSAPFRIIASGTDNNGSAYQRQFATLYRAQIVGVTVEGPTAVTTAAGATAKFKFTVKSLSGAATFTLSATNSRGYPIQVTPQSLNLPSGGSSPAEVAVSVPSNAADGTNFTITLTATKSDDVTVFNSAILNATAIANRPPDINRAQPSIALLWPPNHEMVPVTVVGVTDPDGDSVTIRIDRVMQNEPTDAQGDGDTCPDAQISTASVMLRSERSGRGDGRVYSVLFTATDSRGASASGSVNVLVPHDMGKRGSIDAVATVDSTTCTLH